MKGEPTQSLGVLRVGGNQDHQSYRAGCQGAQREHTGELGSPTEHFPQALNGVLISEY